ncbi:hypothetical protein TraAM80_01817 [Trypanosoma rangeli]|uniref:Uncharacterized protein n=1 Tax=Trypanosoma rangeli TaxID=5698 RepID=A0A422NWY1_TRYRA|nr:uncharacterized protein TraAM80_01817 [Trypanosoma rangeli]RNF09978.1 hypothetical protein TraAM80_01817 [Trypanosoma rangeli]|eukprot:RNF09978.1 hypothetical protein TraAM80_01817 [Trypanosoma rangeli]
MRISPFQALLIVTSVLAATTHEMATAMPLRYMVETVSGVSGVIGTDNGGRGKSLLTRPRALCQGRNEDEILIGVKGFFRTYSRSTQMTGTLLGNGTATDVDDSWANARVDKPAGCVRTLRNNMMFVYFVESQNRLRYITNNSVLSIQLENGLSFTDVTLYGDRLYMTEQNMDKVWSCEIGVDGTPTKCEGQHGFKCEYTKYNGIAVNALGVFVVGSSSQMGICHFDSSGTKISHLPGSYIDVFSAPSGALYAMSSYQLYHLHVEASSMTVVLFAGNSSLTCPPVVDGYTFRMCLNWRLFVLAENEMYLSSHLNTVRAVTLPPAIVPAQLQPPPLPLGYPDAPKVIPEIVALMKEALNKKLGTNSTYAPQNSMHVNDSTWVTDFVVLVQQADFVNVTTPGEVATTDFAAVQRAVEAYYDRIDEALYMDTSIFPFCNATMMNDVMHGLVSVVRKVLEFPLIYANPPMRVTINNITNITRMKLLMPERFNNNTSHVILAELNANTALRDILRVEYGAANVVQLVFPFPQFDFSKLTPVQDMEVRWFIQNMVNAQLEMCKSFMGGGGIAAGGDRNSTCEAVITNRTETLVTRPPFNVQNEYEVFVPQKYNFNVSRCLQGTDWAPLEYLLKNYTAANTTPYKPACNRGCIIGVAVAAAVVLTALIAIVVVLTSKRKRLAAVVAPVRPMFKSTLDDEEELEISNPLDANNEEHVLDRY